MADLNLVPHPLVTRLGMRLAQQTGVALSNTGISAATALDVQATLAQEANKQAAETLSNSIAADEAPPGDDGEQTRSEAPDTPTKKSETPEAGHEDTSDAAPLAPLSSFDPIDIDDLHLDEKQKLAAAIANRPDLPDLALFAGFLGGQVRYRWRLLYLDSCLHSWLLVDEDDILVHQRLADERAPSGLRDVLWVRGTANIMKGTGPQSNEGRFLVGEFTRAGEFAASTTGGTFSAASGLLCEATTPGCCTARRTG